MRALLLDTATPATVAGALAGDRLVERRHDPAPGERPGHAERLLALADEALREAGIGWREIERVVVGVGPGTFTGLRIGVATARALAQGTGAELAPVSTLGALAAGAGAGDRPVLAVLDARRGEAFVAAHAGTACLLGPLAVAPEGLAQLVERAGASPLAVGDGAVRFRDRLAAAGARVPEDESALHRVGAAGLARLGRDAPAVDREALVPEYVREPDATAPQRPVSKQLDIRRLTYADLPQVLAIERRAFPTPWSLAMFVLELSKPGGICLAAGRPLVPGRRRSPATSSARATTRSGT